MIKDGSKVAIDYTLLIDGDVADSSKGRGPLEYTHGAGQIITGLEKALAGLKAGDKKSVDVTAGEAYGAINPAARRVVPRLQVQNSGKLRVGDVVGASSEGHHFRATISRIDDNEVELDFNHPLAGKNLHFDVEIISVK
ncbi:MAG: peptidylprolyl isomerase [Elusimicrobiota bacterium]|jgi:FKBP-type peptidyl-prolyl cis-trans isomerase 2|nr:peptidylprolyl isomerase [Elusimicrobiota bacterium]